MKKNGKQLDEKKVECYTMIMKDSAAPIFEKIEGFDNVGLFSRQLNAFDITLDFLLKRNKAKLLAHSKLTTVNVSPMRISAVLLLTVVSLE